MGKDLQKTGGFLETDAQGFIINPTGLNKIQPEWRPAVDIAVSAGRQHLGDDLHSLYLRGSVAKGEAIAGVSDIDMVVITKAPLEAADTEWTSDVSAGIEKKYPFINGVEFMFGSAEALGRGHRLIIKTQAACLYGPDLADELPPLKPGPDTVMHARSLDASIQEALDYLANTNDETAIQGKCAWIMKRVLRTGCELVMERSGKYTRDLYPCYELFSQYYPEHSEAMHRVLELAVNPSEDAGEVRGVLEGIGERVAAEVSNVFGVTRERNG